MSERSIVVTEKDGIYQIHNSILNEFELLGLFEQIVFDLKFSRQGKLQTENYSESKHPADSNQNTDAPRIETDESAAPVEKDNQPAATAPRISGLTGSSVADLRTRIGNATRAIRDLGGKVETTDLSKMSDEDLQTELEELTAQYKRLKNSAVK